MRFSQPSARIHTCILPSLAFSPRILCEVRRERALCARARGPTPRIQRESERSRGLRERESQVPRSESESEVPRPTQPLLAPTPRIQKRARARMRALISRMLLHHALSSDAVSRLCVCVRARVCVCVCVCCLYLSVSSLSLSRSS
jgi:hypothetical protein